MGWGEGINNLVNSVSMEDTEENPTKYRKIEANEEDDEGRTKKFELRPFRFGEIGDIYYDNRCYDLCKILTEVDIFLLVEPNRRILPIQKYFVIFLIF